ncbi:endonuclease/exonuclease/phosphatase family protein [Brachybacterium sacelli]|uniref:Endonuclease/exonuclease/phosphatase family metal-dependent hydrolase n=2 Tax=Brachybacterium sacelli TaxID=173364 RepID=A0ABS4X6M7_9MICO|nr:endonuclease/exonuclease/phosphatase family protein [Brachybacterium sacelli]MBP2384085.1 endonuclease/exonuclease/phosphatase family metal-dependent hydrolase [Brachybacterium sacelli]
MSLALDRRHLLAGVGAAAVGVTAAITLPAMSAPANPESSGAPEPLIGTATEGRLHVMTFNIRLTRTSDTVSGDPDHWPDRRPILIDLLEREQPTLLGVQEAKFDQLSAIQEALPSHEYVGYGRHGGSKDEYSPLFYDGERFELLAWNQFWLSDTPDVIGSATWGNEISRMIIWARLRDLKTDTEFAMINTHFDHQSEPSRVKSAQAMVDLFEGGELDGLATLVTGDFNSPAGDSEAYTTLVTDGPTVDTWETAEEQLTPAWGTFVGYEEPEEGSTRIDWILSTDEVTTHSAAINVSTDEEGRYPSDHAPVQALVSLP